MTEKRCFVQFPHPGPERESGEDLHIEWSRNKVSDHKRKFMQLNGSWIDKDLRHHSGKLWAWGEWEAPSKRLGFKPLPHDHPDAPRFLWEPYWREPAEEDYPELHNTDPYIFGDSFIYSNCRQISRAGKGLRCLEEGSVIAFGSGKGRKEQARWMLDTVFVVGRSDDYIPADLSTPGKMDELGLSETFQSVTGNILPLLGNAPHRLYFGATPTFDVDGMFSFFPAVPASSNHAFARPAITKLSEEFLNPRNGRRIKGSASHRNKESIKEQWKLLVEEVFDAGFVLGVRAEEPTRIDSTG